MHPNIKKIATYVALTATLGNLASAQLSWDPDANQINDGGAGTWDAAALNWDDGLGAPNVA